MMVLRSMLFVPGNSMRMITKAATLASDAIILDLEDAVPLPDKVTARIMIRDSLKAVKSGGAYTFVRVNALTTQLTAEDLKYVGVEGLDGIMLAKTETKSDIVELDSMLDGIEKERKLEFTLHGKKLKGDWVLIGLKDSPKNWLLIKKKK